MTKITELQNNLEDVLHQLNELQNIPNPAIKIIEDRIEEIKKNNTDDYYEFMDKSSELKSILKQIKEIERLGYGTRN